MNGVEEKLIDGKLYYRKVVGGPWHPVVGKRPQKFVPPRAPIDALINTAQRKLGLRTKTEAILAVGSNPAMICKIRTGVIRPSAEFVLKFYDATGCSIEEIRSIGEIEKTGSTAIAVFGV